MDSTSFSGAQLYVELPLWGSMTEKEGIVWQEKSPFLWPDTLTKRPMSLVSSNILLFGLYSFLDFFKYADP
ncbi:unnamed protein product [Dicrocoelium dendriticum]|nr:unnamed protein product [Dicrocoelium dendriticum]